MKTLDRYVLTVFLRNLALVLLTLMALYALIDFLEKIDDLLKNQAGLKYYLVYPLYRLPTNLSHTLPMAVLLATFATIGGLSRTSQLTALRGSGISIGRISRSLFLCSLVLATLALMANMWLVPWSSRQANYILRTEIRGNTPPGEEAHDLFLRDGNRIISVGQAFAERGVLIDLTVIDLDDRFMPAKRIDAKRAHQESSGQWLLNDVTTRDFRPQTGARAGYVRSPQQLFDLGRQSADMLQLWDQPEDLTIGELHAFITKLSGEGYDPKAYRMEAHMRFATAAIPVIMVLVGIPFALQRGRNAGFARGIIISLVIFAVYFILHAVFSVFGTIAVLPPPVAAWAANLLMVLVGSWFLLGAEH
jgi:lipopolysaccharide export system permease protein